MPRADLSNDVIHWIRGDTDAEAYEVLRQIVDSRRLVGGTGFIRGAYRCVCFSEAPVDVFHNTSGRYRPFGIRLTKSHLFSRSGRPVIYQSDSEFELLSESHRWRHVRYEPTSTPPIDLSWEREWRVKTDELHLFPGETNIVVPHESWALAIVDHHDMDEHSRVEMIAVAYGEEWAMGGEEQFPFSWSVVPTKA